MSIRFTTRLFIPLLALFALFISSCGEDTPGLPGSVVLDPIVSLNVGNGFISSEEDVTLGQSVTFSLNLQDGDNPLQSFRIEENGTTVALDRLTYENIDPVNNPQVITGSNQTGYTQLVTISSPATAGSYNYTFTVTDNNNQSGNTQVTVNFLAAAAEINFLSGGGFVSVDTTLAYQAFDINLNVNANDAGGDLTRLEILQDNELIDASRISFTMTPNFTLTNPYAFIQGEERSATITIRIDPELQQDVEMFNSIFTIRVTDADGTVTERDLFITFENRGTALTMDTTGVFFNASGSRDGGLDLDNGEAVAFNSGAAEIQDEGVNLNASGENWRAQISGENGASVVLVNFNQVSENLNFDNVSAVEEIQSLFDAGSALDGNDNFPDADGDTSSSEEVSQPLVGGEVFAVSRDGRVYLVRFDAVTPVDASNNDSYSVSIKY